MPKELMPGAMLYLAHVEFTHQGTQQNLDNKQSARGNSRNTHFKIHSRPYRSLSDLRLSAHKQNECVLHLWLIWWMTAMLEKR